METAGHLPAELEEQVTQAFGPDLWKALTQLAPVDLASIWVPRLCMSAVERGEPYGSEPPTPNLSAEEKKQICDFNALRELPLICKFIKTYKNLLLAARSSVETRSTFLGEHESRLDLFIRYSTTTHRDFYRSLREYREATILN
jgi:hypothetical protein